MDGHEALTVIDFHMMFIVRACSYSAFFLTLYEWISTINFEALVIWRKGTDVRIRWMYCVSRYFGLMAQALNAFIAAFIQFHHISSSIHCRAWLGFQLVTATCLLLSMDCNLIYRIYALYRGNLWVIFILCALVVCEVVVAGIYGTSAIRHLAFSDHGCLVKGTSSSVAYLIAAQLTTQVAIGLVTLYKSLKLYMQNGWVKIPILTLIARDGLWLFALVTALFASMLASSTKIWASADKLSYIVFPIYVAVLSISNCRITMNITTFAYDRRLYMSSTRRESVELTTVFTNVEDHSPY